MNRTGRCCVLLVIVIFLLLPTFLTAQMLVITTTSVPNATQNASYSSTLRALGGTPPYTWNIYAGMPGHLPAGLTLSSDGVISGTPTATGSNTFTAQATDSHSPVRTARKQFTIVVESPVAITTTSLVPGTQNVAYSASLSASGGVTPYTWSVTAGNLPVGLSLSSGGMISGTPSSNGTSGFIVQVDRKSTRLNSSHRR